MRAPKSCAGKGLHWFKKKKKKDLHIPTCFLIFKFFLIPKKHSLDIVSFLLSPFTFLLPTPHVKEIKKGKSLAWIKDSYIVLWYIQRSQIQSTESAFQRTLICLSVTSVHFPPPSGLKCLHDAPAGTHSTGLSQHMSLSNTLIPFLFSVMRERLSHPLPLQPLLFTHSNV